MKELSERIGDSIWAIIPMVTNKNIKKFTLHGVESGGIWIESQELTNTFLRNVAKRQDLPKTPVFFVPYAKILTIVESVEGPALSEQAFGV